MQTKGQKLRFVNLLNAEHLKGLKVIGMSDFRRKGILGQLSSDESLIGFEARIVAKLCNIVCKFLGSLIEKANNSKTVLFLNLENSFKFVFVLLSLNVYIFNFDACADLYIKQAVIRQPKHSLALASHGV